MNTYPKLLIAGLLLCPPALPVSAQPGIAETVVRASELLDLKWDAQWPATPRKSAAPSNPAVRDALHGAVQNQSGEAQLRAVEAAGAAEDGGMAESLLRLGVSGDPQVAEAALQRLAAAAPEVLLEPALKAAGAGEAGPVWSKFRTPELEERLRGILRNAPSPPRRGAAARALGALRSTASVADLLDAARQPELTAACIDALEAMRAPETGPAWVRLLDHHDPELQRRAVENLATLGGPSAYRAIFAVATAERAGAREAQAAAVDAIAAWPLSEAMPALVTVLEKNPGVRGAALRALRALSGQQLGEDPAAWRAWLQNPNPDPDADAGNVREEMPAQTDSAALPEAVQFVPPGFAPLAPGRKDN